MTREGFLLGIFGHPALIGVVPTLAIMSALGMTKNGNSGAMGAALIGSWIIGALIEVVLVAIFVPYVLLVLLPVLYFGARYFTAP